MYGGNVPTIGGTGTISPSEAVITWAGQAPAISWTFAPTRGVVTFTGNAPSVSNGAQVATSAGFWGANPQRVRRITDEERKEAVRKEREALGILPKPVQNIVRKLAKELDSFDPDEEISQRLEAALKARDQAYLERAESVLRSMLKREREEMEEEEEALFLLM
jgi:hypothetical protein